MKRARTQSGKGGAAVRVQRLVRRLQREGHRDLAEAFVLVNEIMEAYATTADRLEPSAEEFADELTAIAKDWSVSHRPVIHAGRRLPNDRTERPEADHEH